MQINPDTLEMEEWADKLSQCIWLERFQAKLRAEYIAEEIAKRLNEMFGNHR